MSRLKKFLRPFIAGAGVAGTVAAINHGLRDAPLPTNHLGGTQRRWTWRGYDIFAAEAGSGPLIVLVHGIYAGASSYEFRKLFGLLAETHRVVAFDLLGCGLSDRPNLIYSAELFVEQIVDALGEFGTEPTTLSARRWAGRSRSGPPRGQPTASPPRHDLSDRPGRRARSRSVGGSERRHRAASLADRRRGVLERPGLAPVVALVPRKSELLRQKQRYAGDARPLLCGDASTGRALRSGVLRRRRAQRQRRPRPAVHQRAVLIAWGEHAPSVNKFPNAYGVLQVGTARSLVTFAASGLLPHEEEPQAGVRPSRLS